MITRALLLSCAICTVLVTSASLAQSAEPWKRPGGSAGEQITGPDGGTMVWVPAGAFVMGSRGDDPDAQANEQPAHRVRLTNGFWLGKCPVTLRQWKAYCQKQRVESSKATAPGDDHPVSGVNWDEAIAYCRTYGLDLPTEAQWEYAARGADAPRYPWGDVWDPRLCCSAANRGPTGTTFPVGSFPLAVSWCGALDMAGNVWQWCQDWYDGTYYRSAPEIDPPGPEASALTGLRSTEPRRVLKGGAYGLPPGACRSAARIRDKCANGDSDYGFRVVLTPSIAK